jgi:hypothetical protein
MTAMTDEKRVSDLLPCPLCDMYLRKAVDPMLSGMLEHPANLHCPISAVAFTDTSSNRAAWNRRSQQEPDGWRPIETAPKIEGERLILRFEHVNFAIAAPDDRHRWEEVCVGYWTEFNGGGWVWHGIAGKATHWRPLPAAPQSTEGK